MHFCHNKKNWGKTPHNIMKIKWDNVTSLSHCVVPTKCSTNGSHSHHSRKEPKPLSSGTFPGQFLRPEIQTSTFRLLNTYIFCKTELSVTTPFHIPREGDVPQCLVLSCLGTYTLIITITYIYWNTDGQTSIPPLMFTSNEMCSLARDYDCYPSFNACSKYLSSTGNVPTALQEFSHFILTVTTTTL